MLLRILIVKDMELTFAGFFDADLMNVLTLSSKEIVKGKIVSEIDMFNVSFVGIFMKISHSFICAISINRLMPLIDSIYDSSFFVWLLRMINNSSWREQIIRTLRE